MTDEILALITKTKKWREFHRARRLAGNPSAGIEALACNIRIEALKDALEIVERTGR